MLHLRIYLENYSEAQDDELDFVDYEKHFTKNPCNIYIIGSRPRIVIDEKYLKYNNDEVELLFKIQNEFLFEEIYSTLKLGRKIVGELKIESVFPHSRFNLKDDIGFFLHGTEYQNKKDLQLKANYALRNSITTIDISKISDFKALYIGESIKMHKKISPVKRLASHRKFQHVLSKCNSSYVDKEIYIILCSFIGKVDLRAMDTELNAIGDISKIMDKIQRDLSILNANNQFITNVAEAALIDYFDTKEFNRDFIGSFGRKTHKYYSPIIKSQIDSISLELDLSKLCNIYTESTDICSYHSIEYKPKENFKIEIMQRRKEI